MTALAVAAVPDTRAAVGANSGATAAQLAGSRPLPLPPARPSSSRPPLGALAALHLHQVVLAVVLD
jgi:hypothetical protein